MTFIAATIILFFGSLFGGLLGALSGLGGGIIVVPLLVLGLHVDFHYAIGASLVAVIATSTGASAAYLKEGYSNIRVGMLLETATCLGALGGAAIGSILPVSILSYVFGCALIFSSIFSFYQNYAVDETMLPDELSCYFNLDSTYPTKEGPCSYHVQHLPLGYGVMLIAGALSGVLGIGSGVFKVLAMDKVMCLPFKVSTTTSNFMIGVTAATGAGVYLHSGYIDPFLTAPVVLGVTVGSLIGARLLPELKTSFLKQLFACIILIAGLQMIYNAYIG